MRRGSLQLLAARLLALSAALAPAAAFAQGYDHGPVSNQASHTPGSAPGSEIAPRLPEPAGGDAGSPEQYLHAADRALEMHKTGLAQQALEMAETRMLDRSTLASEVSMPDANPEVRALRQAREALGRHELREAHQAIREALNDAPGAAGAPPPQGYTAPSGYPAPPGGLGTPPPGAPGFPPPSSSQ